MKNEITARLKFYPLALLGIFLIDYLVLPAYTFKSVVFWLFLALSAAIIQLAEVSAVKLTNKRKARKAKLIKNPIVIMTNLFAVVFLAVVPASTLLNSPMFRDSDYANLIDVQDREFSKDFPAIENDIPMIDKDTATKLGERAIGGMSELVSQFTPSSEYMQINIDNHPYRVTPMKYAKLTRWIKNRHEGIPNYLLVDMVTGEVNVEKPEENMMYTNSEKFGRNVKRHLRKQYPNVIFKNPSFEVDDDGNPYYIATTYEPKFFLSQQEPTGVIVLNAINGESEQYSLEDTPEWIDRVYSAELIMKQLKYKGQFSNGYWNNTVFGSKVGVTVPTDDYNYIPMNDDVYLYTGVTSVNSDSSNIGFYLVNMRTKEAEFYPVTSADERSAMDSAEGVVQEREYLSTMPILVSLENKPYYISSLKDNSGLVRLYALIDAQNYQKVLIDETVEGLISQLNGGQSNELKDVETIETEEELIDFAGTIEEVNQAVVSGDTVYYLMIDGSIYKANVKLHEKLPFISAGTDISGEVTENNEFKTIIIN